MLRWRMLLGTVFVAAVVGLCWLDVHAETPGTWLMPLAVAIAILGSGEMIWMMRQRGLQPHAGVIYVTNVLMVEAVWVSSWAILVERQYVIAPQVRGFLERLAYAMLPLGSLGLVTVTFALGVLAIFLVEMRRYTGPGGIAERIGATLLGIVYVGWLLSFVVALRLHLGEMGMVCLASLVAVVKMCDIGAYTAGRLFGRHKMAPVLSPKKTWEGFVGGLLFGCCGAIATWWYSINYLDGLARPYAASIPLSRWIVLGVLISITGVLGDLAESLLKRDLGVKDSSPWMPGFGGVLDIMDSILFAAPVAYLYWVLLDAGMAL